LKLTAYGSGVTYLWKSRRLRTDMPANLPPQYKEAEAKLKAAKTPEEKIGILQEMLAIMPKHKGTDHLKADLRSRISKLEKMRSGKKARSRSDSRFMVEREGAAQIAVVGPPNCGKSHLVSSLSGSDVDVADYPFTTSLPTPRMMEYEDISIQIIDMPPITYDFMEWWQTALARGADLIILVVDLSSETLLEETEMVRKRLDSSRISLTNVAPGEKEIGRAYKRTLLVGTNLDWRDSLSRLRKLKEQYGDEYPVMAVSNASQEGIPDLSRAIFSMLEVVRVYTKPPGKPASMKDPVILPKGSTVLDAARLIHKDFASRMKFTRKWGKGAFDGQRVEKNHVVEDGDVLEFHI
jgi:ribosome-interacting GTPase 1